MQPETARGGAVVPSKTTIERMRDALAGNPNFVSLSTTFLLLAGLVAVFYAIAPHFLSWRNIGIVLNQSSPYMILGVGMTLVITTKGIDLSIGATVALCGTVIGLVLVSYGLPVWLGIAAALVTGTLCGLFNGMWITRFRVPPLIVTLGTMVAFRGLAYVVLEHKILFGFPDSFLWLARGRLYGVSPAVYIALAVVVWGYFLMNRSRLGQHITAIGGNEEAARLAGIDVNRTRLIVYSLMGLLAGVATVVWIGRLNSAQAALGYGIEFHVIALVVLGGTSLFGGRGLIMGSLMGALILAVLENGLVISGLSAFVQQVMLGLLFILVVVFRTLQLREGQSSG